MRFFVEFPCGFTVSITDSFSARLDDDDFHYLVEFYSSCPLHGKKCKKG